MKVCNLLANDYLGSRNVKVGMIGKIELNNLKNTFHDASNGSMYNTIEVNFTSGCVSMDLDEIQAFGMETIEESKLLENVYNKISSGNLFTVLYKQNQYYDYLLSVDGAIDNKLYFNNYAYFDDLGICIDFFAHIIVTMMIEDYSEKVVEVNTVNNGDMEIKYGGNSISIKKEENKFKNIIDEFFKQYYALSNFLGPIMNNNMFKRIVTSII